VPKADREWLDEIAHATGSDLLRFLRGRLSSTADAEDLAQEVYLRLLRVNDTSQIRNRRAYVLRVAANIVMEWRMLARNRLAHTPDPLDYMADDENTEHQAWLEQQTAELEAALDTLTPKCRAVLIMHRRDRYTMKEIAATMGISVSMVKKYLVKGLSVCQAQVSFDPVAATGNQVRDRTSERRNAGKRGAERDE